MRPLTVRSVRIGEGMPKICVPIVGDSLSGLMEEAGALAELGADMAEWRVDHYSYAFNMDGSAADTDLTCSRILEAAGLLRGILGDIPLLFTLRTEEEGGKVSLSLADYEKINGVAASSGLADLIDVELFTEGERFSDIVEALHSSPVFVVGSGHDFSKTPPEEEMLSRLCRMREGGADICKIAVMPSDMKDVLTLLTASLAMREEYPDTPLITIAMGKYGLISRSAGEYFGSDITFASAAKASAPGQISVDDCRYMQSLIHRALTSEEGSI